MCPNLENHGLDKCQGNPDLGETNSRESHCSIRFFVKERQGDSDQMSIKSSSVQICHCWHQPMVDLFATKLNHKLPVYVSPVPDSQAWETDALNISWEGLDAYVFCPVALIPQVIQKLTTYRCRIVMIAPGWPGMSWFWDLVDLSTKLPLRLPLWVNLLTQPFSNRLHNNLAYLNLHAWHLESVMNIQEDSQRRWQSKLRSLRGTPQGESMNQGGPFLGSGVKRARWTSQIPLFQM